MPGWQCAAALLAASSPQPRPPRPLPRLPPVLWICSWQSRSFQARKVENEGVLKTSSWSWWRRRRAMRHAVWQVSGPLLAPPPVHLIAPDLPFQRAARGLTSTALRLQRAPLDGQLSSSSPHSCGKSAGVASLIALEALAAVAVSSLKRREYASLCARGTAQTGMCSLPAFIMSLLFCRN